MFAHTQMALHDKTLQNNENSFYWISLFIACLWEKSCTLKMSKLLKIVGQKLELSDSATFMAGCIVDNLYLQYITQIMLKMSCYKVLILSLIHI